MTGYYKNKGSGIFLWWAGVVDGLRRMEWAWLCLGWYLDLVVVIKRKGRLVFEIKHKDQFCIFLILKGGKCKLPKVIIRTIFAINK